MGAGVMLRSLYALRHVDAGFDGRNVITMDLNLPGARYKGADRKREFYNTVLDRVRALPGVQSASAVDTLPASGGGSVQPLVPEGRAELKTSEQPTVSVRMGERDYMRTMGVPLL